MWVNILEGSTVELSHCPVMKDQWDCVLNVLEELGDEELFLKYQCSTDIFFFLLLLPSMLPIDRQTNIERVEIDSEENSWFSRVELLRLLLVVLFDSVEEDEWLSSRSRTHREEFPGSISIHFLQVIGMMLDESTGSPLCGFAFAFDLAAKTFTIYRDVCSSGKLAGTSVLLWFESITNSFDPWEILTQDWELCFLRDQILTSIPCLPYR